MQTAPIIAAYFTNGSTIRPAQLDINRIENGRRELIEVRTVSGKREARAVAAQFNATPWNF